MSNEFEKRIVLVDGPTFARLMIEHGVGIRVTATYHLMDVDEDYFEEA